MSFSNLLKQLKKKLRVKKRWLTLGSILLLAGGALLLVHTAGDSGRHEQEPVKTVSGFAPAHAVQSVNAEEAELLRSVETSGRSWNVEIMNIYVCGEEMTKVGLLPVLDIMQYHKDHPAAAVSLDKGETVRFTETIDDLSPKCKEDAYFGLDKSGNLSLFHDVPEKEQVIRTFYQLNIERMRSSLPPDMMEELRRGIRVTDIAEYNSVLSTFGEFALALSEQAMAVKR